MNKRRSDAIARAYISKKFNGAEAGMQVFNTKKRKNASIMMRKALKSPQVQNSIQEQLSKSGVDSDYINSKFKKAIDYNLDNGKPSQAVGAQLLIQAQKIYNYIPKDNKEVVRQERKVLLDKDYKVIGEELRQITTLSQDMLNDL